MFKSIKQASIWKGDAGSLKREYEPVMISSSSHMKSKDATTEHLGVTLNRHCHSSSPI